MDNKEQTIIELKSPFWSAGMTYDWDIDLKDSVGFGVALYALNGEGDVIIMTKYGNFKIDKNEAKKICSKYKSFFKAKNTMLAVIPRVACIKI